MPLRTTVFSLSISAIALLSHTALADTVYLLQLGSYPQFSEARQRWNDATDAYPDQLKGLQVNIAKVKLPPDDFEVYRTQLGPVSTRAEAQEICDTMTAKGEDCFVVETAMYDPSGALPAAEAPPATPPADAGEGEMAEAAMPELPDLPELPDMPEASGTTGAKDLLLPDAITETAEAAGEAVEEAVDTVTNVVAPAKAQKLLVPEDNVAKATPAPVPEVEASLGPVLEPQPEDTALALEPLPDLPSDMPPELMEISQMPAAPEPAPADAAQAIVVDPDSAAIAEDVPVSVSTKVMPATDFEMPDASVQADQAQAQTVQQALEQAIAEAESGQPAPFPEEMAAQEEEEESGFFSRLFGFGSSKKVMKAPAASTAAAPAPSEVPEPVIAEPLPDMPDDMQLVAELPDMPESLPEANPQSEWPEGLPAPGVAPNLPGAAIDEPNPFAMPETMSAPPGPAPEPMIMANAPAEPEPATEMPMPEPEPMPQAQPDPIPVFQAPEPEAMPQPIPEPVAAPAPPPPPPPPVVKKVEPKRVLAPKPAPAKQKPAATPKRATAPAKLKENVVATAYQLAQVTTVQPLVAPGEIAQQQAAPQQTYAALPATGGQPVAVAQPMSVQAQLEQQYGMSKQPVSMQQQLEQKYANLQPGEPVVPVAPQGYTAYDHNYVPAAPPVTQVAAAAPAPYPSGPGKVDVAEAIRVPVSEDRDGGGLGTDGPEVSPLTVARTKGFPSSNPQISQYWAEMSYFPDKQHALTFWEDFRRSHDGIPPVRVRVTEPYVDYGRSGRAALRVGPFEGLDIIEEMCYAAEDVWDEYDYDDFDDGRCVAVSDFGASGPANMPRERSSFLGKLADMFAGRTSGNQDGPTYWVQLGAFPSPQEADQSWDAIQHQHEDLLGDMDRAIATPAMSSAQEPNFRLRTGPFERSISAHNVCSRLKNRGVPCLVIYSN